MLSLFWIMLVAVLATLLASQVPRKLVPEVVLLIIGGVLIGPYALDLAETGEAVDLLRELGLGMLFLLAGYEIELDELTGRGGRRALATWLVSLGLAFGAVALLAALDVVAVIQAEAAVAIALTSTALGTLLPILKDRALLGTRFGTAVLHHGAYGELGPIVAMAVLLGTRGALGSLLALALFGILALAVTALSIRVTPGSRLHAIVQAGAHTTGQTPVRLVVLLLVSLGALAIAFALDVALGAFAAGFVLRRVLPRGDEALETKLEGLAFGLLIPVFFVTSGMAIDAEAVVTAPLALLSFVALILLVRGVPVWLAARTQRDAATEQPVFDQRDSLRIGLYGATGLPIIVAVTTVAVDAGEMSATSASVLVAGGAITVLLLPMTATLLERRPATAAAPGA